MTMYVWDGSVWQSARPPYVDTTGSDAAAPTEVLEGWVYVQVAPNTWAWRQFYAQSLDDMGNLTEGSVTHTSVTMSFSTVTDATHYEVYRDSGGGFALFNTITSSPYTNTGGIETNGTYSYKMRPKAFVGGEWIYGGYSGTITANVGRPEVRDSGTSGNIYRYANSRGQWRNDVGWGYVGTDMRQGYYSSSYGGDGYRGIADYGSTGVRDTLRSGLGGGTTGTNRQLNGTCYSCEVYLYKETGVGSGGGITIGFYTSDEGTNSGLNGKPHPDGSKVSRGSTASGAGTWYNLGTAHGQRLGDGERSVMIYQSTSPTGNYASFNGGDTGRVRLRWTWNYVTQTYIAPSWQ